MSQGGWIFLTASVNESVNRRLLPREVIVTFAREPVAPRVKHAANDASEFLQFQLGNFWHWKIGPVPAAIWKTYQVLGNAIGAGTLSS